MKRCGYCHKVWFFSFEKYHIIDILFYIVYQKELLLLKLGYARVSAKDQNPERQLKKFRDIGIEERYIFRQEKRKRF